MRVISAKYHFFLYKLFPMLLFGIGSPFIFFRGFDKMMESTATYRVLFILLYSCLGYLIWQSVRSMVDEVQDFGGYLLVRKSGRSERVNIENIINVSADYPKYSGAPVLRLRVDHFGIFGSEIVFIPAGGKKISKDGRRRRNAVEEDLIKRVDLARRQQK